MYVWCCLGRHLPSVKQYMMCGPFWTALHWLAVVVLGLKWATKLLGQSKRNSGFAAVPVNKKVTYIHTCIHTEACIYTHTCTMSCIYIYACVYVQCMCTICMPECLILLSLLKSTNSAAVIQNCSSPIHGHLSLSR